MLDGFTNPRSLAEITGLPISEDLEFAIQTAATLLVSDGSAALSAAKAPAIAQTVKRLGVPFVSRVPALKRLFGLSDDVAEITVKAGKAGAGAADDVAATTTAVPKTNVTSQVRRRVAHHLVVNVLAGILVVVDLIDVTLNKGDLIEL